MTISLNTRLNTERDSRLRT